MNFSAKDAKAIISENKNIQKSLKENSLLADSYLQRVRHSASLCRESGTFNNVSEQGIVYGKNISSDSVTVLLNDLYYLIALTPYSRLCSEAEAELVSATQNATKQLSVFSKSLPRLFASQKQKQAGENAYLFFHSDSYTALKNKLQELLDSGNKLKTSLPSNITEDFNARKSEYRTAFNMAVAEKDKGTLQCISSLSYRYTVAENKANEIKYATDRANAKIRECAHKVIGEDVLKIIEDISVDDAFSGRGLRLKALKEAGFTTVADVYVAPTVRLADINGISEEGALVLKRLAQENCLSLQKAAKLKLSADKKTPAACALTEAVYIYKQNKNLLLRADELKNTLAIDSQINFLKSVSGTDWLFFSDEDRENVRFSYSSALNAINEYSDTVKITFNAKKEAWDDFSANPIAYFNIIESIVPELLGNDDTVYGLPEDVAREIRDEAFFPDGLTCSLRRYQEWGVKYILNRKRVLLGDEMGLGKTVQAIAAMVSLKNTGETHFAVICPASVLSNWCKEIEEKSKFTVIKIHGSTRQSALKEWIACGGVAYHV